MITIFTQAVRPSQNFNIKRKSLPARTVVWPSGSLMIPILFFHAIKQHTESRMTSKLLILRQPLTILHL